MSGQDHTHPGYAYRIRGGRVHRRLLPDEPTVLPGAVRSGRVMDSRVLVQKGLKDETHWENWTLWQIADLWSRIVPWCTLYCAPHWPGCDDSIRHFAGKAYVGQSEAIMCTTYTPVYSLDVAAHEAWHLVEEYLSEDWISSCTVMRAGTIDFPVGYYDSDTERRARAFEGWSKIRTLSCAAPIGVLSERYEHIWSGGLGREVMATLKKADLTALGLAEAPLPQTRAEWGAHWLGEGAWDEVRRPGTKEKVPLAYALMPVTPPPQVARTRRQDINTNGRTPTCTRSSTSLPPRPRRAPPAAAAAAPSGPLRRATSAWLAALRRAAWDG